MKTKLLFVAAMLFTINGFAQNLHSHPNAASLTTEANNTTGWTSDGAPLTSDATEFQNGVFSIKLDYAGRNNRTASYGFTAVAGQVYNISIWAKVGAQSSDPAFANWTGFQNFVVTPISGATWTQYNFVLTANATNPVIRIFSGSKNGGVNGDHVFFDAVSITGASGGDTQAPSAVTSLVASNTTSTSTSLSWAPSTDNVGVTNYEVFQDGASLGFTGGATSFNVTGLTAATSYVFNVLARDAVPNISSAGNNANITTTGSSDTQPPSAVTTLAATNTTFTTTNLNWSPSTDNIGVTNYEVFQDGSSLGLTGGATTLNVTGLSSGISYNFTVLARDAALNISAAGNTANVTTLTDTQAPTAVVTLAASNTTSNSTNLSWSASTDNVAVTNYEVFQDGSSIGFSAGASSFIVSGLLSNTSYGFTVLARDAVPNISAAGNTVNITTPGSTDYTSANANLPTVDWQARDLFADRNVGIGTTNTQGYRLAVAGNVVAEEVKVALQVNWPDFVFKKEYDLPSLSEVQAHINKYGHLINIPSAVEVEKSGIELGKMNARLLQKIEELTLYTLEQELRIKKLEAENVKIEQLSVKLAQFEARLNEKN